MTSCPLFLPFCWLLKMWHSCSGEDGQETDSMTKRAEIRDLELASLTQHVVFHQRQSHQLIKNNLKQSGHIDSEQTANIQASNRNSCREHRMY